MEKRTNPKTGKLEVKVEPNGLPAIWVEILCDRCEEFKECLGFKKLSEIEWEETSKLIENLSYLPKRHHDKFCKV